MNTSSTWLKQSKGKKIVLWSVLLGVIGIAPLGLYIIFGPKDGNPIGLGLLAMLATPASIISAGLGSILMIVEFFTRKKE